MKPIYCYFLRANVKKKRILNLTNKHTHSLTYVLIDFLTLVLSDGFNQNIYFFRTA